MGIYRICVLFTAVAQEGLLCQ